MENDAQVVTKKDYDHLYYWSCITISLMGALIIALIIILGFKVVDAKKVEFQCVDYYAKELCKLDYSYCSFQSGWHIIGTDSARITGNMALDDPFKDVYNKSNVYSQRQQSINIT